MSVHRQWQRLRRPGQPCSATEKDIARLDLTASLVASRCPPPAAHSHCSFLMCNSVCTARSHGHHPAEPPPRPPSVCVCIAVCWLVRHVPPPAPSCGPQFPPQPSASSAAAPAATAAPSAAPARAQPSLISKRVQLRLSAGLTLLGL